MKHTPLVRALQSSSFHVLLMLTQKALIRSGFGDVQILDRRQTRQKSRDGGHEISCYTIVGSLPVRVIVKVVNDAVRLRMMDELAGAILRTGADFGLIVTPHHITRIAAREQERYIKSKVHVLDGQAIASILERHGIGMRGKGEIDYAFFGELELQSNRLLNFLANDRL